MDPNFKKFGNQFFRLHYDQKNTLNPMVKSVFKSVHKHRRYLHFCDRHVRSIQYAATRRLQLRAWPILRTGLRPVQLLLVTSCRHSTWRFHLLVRIRRFESVILLSKIAKKCNDLRKPVSNFSRGGGGETPGPPHSAAEWIPCLVPSSLYQVTTHPSKASARTVCRLNTE